MLNQQRKHYVPCACSVLVSIHYVSWLGKLKHRREAVLETGCCFRGPLSARISSPGIKCRSCHSRTSVRAMSGWLGKLKHRREAWLETGCCFRGPYMSAPISSPDIKCRSCHSRTSARAMSGWLGKLKHRREAWLETGCCFRGPPMSARISSPGIKCRSCHSRTSVRAMSGWLGKLKHRREAWLETGCCFREPYVCPNLVSRYQMPLMSFTDFGAGDVWMAGQAQALARGCVGDRMLPYVCPNLVSRYQMPLMSLTDFGAGDVWMAGQAQASARGLVGDRMLLQGALCLPESRLPVSNAAHVIHGLRCGRCLGGWASSSTGARLCWRPDVASGGLMSARISSPGIECRSCHSRTSARAMSGWLGKLKNRREAWLETGCCFRGPYVCPNPVFRYQMPLSLTDFGAGDVWMAGRSHGTIIRHQE